MKRIVQLAAVLGGIVAAGVAAPGPAVAASPTYGVAVEVSGRAHHGHYRHRRPYRHHRRHRHRSHFSFSYQFGRPYYPYYPGHYYGYSRYEVAPAPVERAPAVTAPVPSAPTSACAQEREYQTTLTIDGRQVEAFGTACLQPDGSWRLGAPRQVP